MPPHALASPVVAGLEHVVVLGICVTGGGGHGVHHSTRCCVLTQRPVVALSLLAPLAGDLDETFVEAEVVSDRVLPAFGLQLPVVGKVFADIVIDLAELQLALLAVLDGHGDHGHVAVRRLRVGI